MDMLFRLGSCVQTRWVVLLCTKFLNQICLQAVAQKEQRRCSHWKSCALEVARDNAALISDYAHRGTAFEAHVAPITEHRLTLASTFVKTCVKSRLSCELTGDVLSMNPAQRNRRECL